MDLLSVAIMAYSSSEGTGSSSTGMSGGVGAAGGTEKIAYTRIPLLSEIGRKSILIYMLHRPVCMLICIIWSSAEKAGLFF